MTAMIKLRTIKYYIEEAFKCLIRNGVMTLAGIMIVASCVFILSASFCVALNLEYVLEQFGASLGFTVIVSDELDDETVDKIRSKIVDIEHVSDVKYKSSHDALVDLSAQFEDTRGILSGLEQDNPLPRSFEIQVTQPKFQADIIKAIQHIGAEVATEINLKVEASQPKTNENFSPPENKGVLEVKTESNVVDALVAINNGVRIISLFITIALTAISVVIIMNTIKVTMNNRKTEINIMKYVGATDWFIRWPFVIEGILTGTIGALIPLAVCRFGYNKVIEVIFEKVSLLKNLVVFVPVEQVFSVLIPVSLGLGIGIGIFGSVSSIRRYLKV